MFNVLGNKYSFIFLLHQMKTMEVFHAQSILFGKLNFDDFMLVAMKDPINIPLIGTSSLTEEVTIVPIFASKYMESYLLSYDLRVPIPLQSIKYGSSTDIL